MTPTEQAEFAIFKLANEEGKFAIEVGYVLSRPIQKALEQMMMKDWVRLIDLSSVGCVPGRFMRVFRMMPEALAHYRALAKESQP